MENLKEGDLLLCTVSKIEGPTTFVKLPNGKTGTIVTSEIAPGRIRNLRKYVVPNKKIVCKVLRVLKDHIELSLRRVNGREKKEIMQVYKKEQTAKSAIRSILKDKATKAEEEILKDFESLNDFFQQARDNPELVGKYIPKGFQDQITKITQKKKKGVEIKKILNLKCLEKDGIKRIKKIFHLKTDRVKIIYISAGKFQLTLKHENYKDGNKELEQIIEKIKDSSKQNACEFEINDKK